MGNTLLFIVGVSFGVMAGIFIGGGSAKAEYPDMVCSSFQTGAVWDWSRDQCVLLIKKPVAPRTVGP